MTTMEALAYLRTDLVGWERALNAFPVD